MRQLLRPRLKLPYLLALLVLVAAGATAGLTALLVTVFEHKEDAKEPFYRVVELNDTIEDPAVWGKNFPRQYDAYLLTREMTPTRFGGSEAVPRTPTDADPRTVTSRSKLEEDPRLVTMWAGYAFSKDYRERRGHSYMLEDQMYTLRQQATKQPGSCINCHASVYTTFKSVGQGDLAAGFQAVNAMSYADARALVSHPVSCIDCHDPDTMALRVTRPAFIEGMRNLKASQGIENYDVNVSASRQEMRSFVCGQCHVEYYFQGPDKQLVFPWDNGLKVENIVAYYDEIQFKDWVHADTGAPVLKAQHPEFETWSQGIHAASGVACADCHMPYTRSGAMKVSDHHVQSPLLNVNHACQTCHRWSEEELKARVDNIQQTTYDLRSQAMDALIQLIGDIKTAKDAGKTDDQLASPRDYQRKAQFYLDFVDAENSTGFHATQETARILGQSIDFSRKGQLALRDQGAALAQE